MTPTLIDMAGQVIGHWHVLEYAPTREPSGARWLVLCLECKNQQVEKGSNLRRMQRGGFRIVCHGCGR